MTRYVYDETDSFKSKQNLYYMFDDLGSVTAITDDTGTPVQMYMYDAYGNVTNAQNDPINNFAFVGRYGGWKDWDTGLTQFLHRWYDSKDGCWLSRDPIGVDGGVNLYNYTDNNPVNRVDVTGLCGEPRKEETLSMPVPSNVPVLREPWKKEKKRPCYVVLTSAYVESYNELAQIITYRCIWSFIEQPEVNVIYGKLSFTVTGCVYGTCDVQAITVNPAMIRLICQTSANPCQY